MAQNVRPADSVVSSEGRKDAQEPGATTGTSQVTKRLQRELMSLMMPPLDEGISAFPEGDSLFKWIATVEGPQESVYAGLKFKLKLDFPAGYPYTSPTVRFSTPCFHPNVDQHGNICLDILKEKWSALYEVRTILLSIQSLLGEPNNDSPLNTTAAQMWADQKTYKRLLLENYNTKSQ